MLADREERGVNGEMKKWVGPSPKREELLRNSFREDIELPMGYDKYCAQRVVVKLAVKVANEWRTGDAESDWGLISRVTKICLGKR